MAFTEVHTVMFSKDSKRQLNEKIIRTNFAEMLTSINTRTLKAQGWTIATDSDVFWNQNDNGEIADYRYTTRAAVRVTYLSDVHPPVHLDLARIVKSMHTRANAPVYGKWSVTALDGEDYSPITDGDAIGDVKDVVGYVDVSIPETWSDNFTHLYGLDDRIMRVRLALEAAIMSNFANRYHVVLTGPPGCGKSDICRSMKRALGEEAVMEFDATATTAAGAIKELAERDILPRVLVVEEIEKADEKALGFLLGLCDQRGEIRKTTARATIQRDTKLFVVATVNDMELFRKLQSGALASRFANTVWFSRPTRDQLGMILHREISKVNGDHAWADATLDFCEEINETDPRAVTAICLCGREKLLDGSYQKMLRATAEPTPTTTDHTF